MKPPLTSSDFDGSLRRNDPSAECEAEARGRVAAWQLQREAKQGRIPRFISTREELELPWPPLIRMSEGVQRRAHALLRSTQQQPM
jgi:hypothetical protein